MRSSVVLHGQRPVARSVSALLQGWRFAALLRNRQFRLVVKASHVSYLVGCHSFVAVVGHSRQVVAGAVEAAVAGNCMIGRVASVVRRIAGEGLVEGSYSYAGAAAAAVVDTGRPDTAVVAAEDLRIVRYCMTDSRTCQFDQGATARAGLVAWKGVYSCVMLPRREGKHSAMAS
jgi:hypothetical protein